MEIKNDKVILRDFIEADIEDKIYWETVEREWQLWDAPWENDEEVFDKEKYRSERLEWLAKEKDENRMRYGFQICINDESQKHIGWCNVYHIDDNYKYIKGNGNCTIGIGIPDLSSRRKGYATYSWDLLIQYLLNNGIDEIYTQTWSGNNRVIGLMEKFGFEECNREYKIRIVRGQLYDGLTYKLNKKKYNEFRKKNEILDFLKKSEIRNINIINFIKNYPIHYMDKIGDSIIVKGTSDKNWIYISSKCEEEVKKIKNSLDNNDKNFAAIEEWMVPILSEGNVVKWKLSTMKLILPNNVCMDEPKHNVSKLTVNDAEFLYENSEYKDVISIEYIIDRITKGESSCIRYMNKPIAWSITQDDGAIGFLHVLPEYRRKGYAQDVTVDIIKKVRNKNKIPFVHIEETNEKSMNLALGLGFKKDRVVSLFEIE